MQRVRTNVFYFLNVPLPILLYTYSIFFCLFCLQSTPIPCEHLNRLHGRSITKPLSMKHSQYNIVWYFRWNNVWNRENKKLSCSRICRGQSNYNEVREETRRISHTKDRAYYVARRIFSFFHSEDFTRSLLDFFFFFTVFWRFSLWPCPRTERPRQRAAAVFVRVNTQKGHSAHNTRGYHETIRRNLRSRFIWSNKRIHKIIIIIIIIYANTDLRDILLMFDQVPPRSRPFYIEFPCE